MAGWRLAFAQSEFRHIKRRRFRTWLHRAPHATLLFPPVSMFFHFSYRHYWQPRIMMQPTPAPSSPPRSPPAQEDHSTINPPPQNVGNVPFSVLVGLFLKLQTEKKPERRRQYLNSWFTVCAQSKLRICLYSINCSTGVSKTDMTFTLSYVSSFPRHDTCYYWCLMHERWK